MTFEMSCKYFYNLRINMLDYSFVIIGFGYTFGDSFILLKKNVLVDLDV